MTWMIWGSPPWLQTPQNQPLKAPSETGPHHLLPQNSLRRDGHSPAPENFWFPQFWLVVSTPLKNMKVSWDDEIPNIWKHKKCTKMFQTTNQIFIVSCLFPPCYSIMHPRIYWFLCIKPVNAWLGFIIYSDLLVFLLDLGIVGASWGDNGPNNNKTSVVRSLNPWPASTGCNFPVLHPLPCHDWRSQWAPSRAHGPCRASGAGQHPPWAASEAPPHRTCLQEIDATRWSSGATLETHWNLRIIVDISCGLSEPFPHAHVKFHRCPQPRLTSCTWKISYSWKHFPKQGVASKNQPESNPLRLRSHTQVIRVIPP